MNEWNVTSGSQTEYQDFGKAQLEVYDTASFGWAYWTLKNDRKHWDFEWNIRNKYLQLGNYLGLLFLFYLNRFISIKGTALSLSFSSNSNSKFFLYPFFFNNI